MQTMNKGLISLQPLSLQITQEMTSKDVESLDFLTIKAITIFKIYFR